MPEAKKKAVKKTPAQRATEAKAKAAKEAAAAAEKAETEKSADVERDTAVGAVELFDGSFVDVDCVQVGANHPAVTLGKLNPGQWLVTGKGVSIVRDTVADLVDY